jgi:hypothetical protein
MSETIRWSVQFQVVGGPGITKSNSLTVDGYDKITKTISTVSSTPGANPPSVDVDIQPVSDANAVQLMVICADPCGPWLSYTIDGGSASFTLDAPHTLIGAGAVGLMPAVPSGTPPKKLTFTVSASLLAQDPVNSQATSSTVQILVGRNAS